MIHNRLRHYFAAEGASGRSPLPQDAGDQAFDEPAKSSVDRLSRTLASHPAVAIGAAFAVGLLIGKWVKR